MREDLQRLLIGEEEFLEITGVSYTEIKYGFNYFVSLETEELNMN